MLLPRQIDFKLETIPKLIYACFVLHKLKNNVTVDQDAVNIQIQFIQKNVKEHQDIPDISNIFLQHSDAILIFQRGFYSL